MKEVQWKDDRGRFFLSKLENHEPDTNAPGGILVGPPDIVDDLGLPEDIATNLHNQLFHRKLWTMKDLERNPQSLLGALQAALNIDVARIMNLYRNYYEPDTNQEV